MAFVSPAQAVFCQLLGNAQCFFSTAGNSVHKHKSSGEPAVTGSHPDTSPSGPEHFSRSLSSHLDDLWPWGGPQSDSVVCLMPTSWRLLPNPQVATRAYCLRHSHTQWAADKRVFAVTQPRDIELKLYTFPMLLLWASVMLMFSLLFRLYMSG